MAHVQVSPYLEVHGLCKSYGKDEARVEVLRNIDVSVGKGEICVLLGPSGSGKSTSRRFGFHSRRWRDDY